MINEKKFKQQLRMLNEENYLSINLGLYQRVSDIERALYRIEFYLFGNDDIQRKAWEGYSKKEAKKDGN